MMVMRSWVAIFLFASALGAGSVALAGTPDEAETLIRAAGIKGGLIVHLGCGEGQFTARLAVPPQFLVHGLDGDHAAVAKARQRLAAQGVLGRASVEHSPLKSLPYHDNLVNLVVAEDLGAILGKGLPLEEIQRVLCPGGSAWLGVARLPKRDVQTRLAAAGIEDFQFIENPRLWLVVHKPRPPEIDEWTHWNHGPDGNLVSQDRRISTPKSIQWVAGPSGLYDRIDAGPAAGSVASMVTAGGRKFYLMGYRTTHLVARDAVNGTILWIRELPGLAKRQLVAADDKVFVSCGPLQFYGAEKLTDLIALDAASGRTVVTYGKTRTYDLLYSKGLLISIELDTVRAFDAPGGKMKWSKPLGGKDFSREVFWPPTHNTGAVIDEDQLILMGPRELTSIDARDGKTKWKRDYTPWGDPRRSFLRFAKGGIVLLRVDLPKEILFHAFSSQDGHWLWTHKQAENRGQDYRDDNGTLADGLVWTYRHTVVQGTLSDYVYEALGPATGQVKRSMKTPMMRPDRCYQMQSTERFILGNRPFFVVDRQSGKVDRFEGLRGNCASGIGLGNGLVYNLMTGMPPRSGDLAKLCSCNPAAVVGLVAYSCDGAAEDGQPRLEASGRIETGPGIAPAAAALAAEATPGTDQWSTFRHDGGRTARASCEVPFGMSPLWEQRLLDSPGGASAIENDWPVKRVTPDRITGPTAAEGLVFVSLTDAHRLVALDRQTGKIAWTYTTGGRLDTPPTIHNGLCLLGCHDGWVYCLSAKDGQLIWRFRAAPAERRIVVCGQVESSWPVIGGVLVCDGLAYVAAGIGAASDGGCYVTALAPESGKVIWSDRRIASKEGTWGWIRNTFAGNADLLSTDGRSIAIGGSPHGRLDLKTGKLADKEPLGTLAVNLFAWRYGARFQKVYQAPVAYDRPIVFGCRAVEDKAGVKIVTNELYARSSQAADNAPDVWKSELPLPLRVESIVKAGDRVLVAISYNASDRRNGEIRRLSAKDGSLLGTCNLPSAPALEGLAVACGRVYVSLQDGKVLCLGTMPN